LEGFESTLSSSELDDDDASSKDEFFASVGMDFLPKKFFIFLGACCTLMVALAFFSFRVLRKNAGDAPLKFKLRSRLVWFGVISGKRPFLVVGLWIEAGAGDGGSVIPLQCVPGVDCCERAP